MQGPIAEALTLVAAGNAALAGHDTGGLWPDGGIFRYTLTCEFRLPSEDGGDDFRLLAADPAVWIETLKPWCKGLRLHHAPRALEPGQMAGIAPRMLVAFVGGGPRWLIEAVGADKSEIWEGFNRLGDSERADNRIWLNTYIRQSQIDLSESYPAMLAPTRARLAAILPEIEAFARAETYDNFADCFRRAIDALEKPPTRSGGLDEDWLPTELSGLREAIGHAWVFGGMGSWNDIGGTGPRYDELSDQLFSALNDAVCGLANATYRG